MDRDNKSISQKKHLQVRSDIRAQRTALMGFAALWVYYFHIMPVGLFEGTPLAEFEWFIHRIGFCGVDIFMFLSAYGLYHRFRRSPVKTAGDYLRYMGKRLLRIYPVIIPVALLIALVDNLPLRSLLARLTFYDSFAISIYKFLWFVPCILVLYLLAPFYHRLFELSAENHRKNGTGFITPQILTAIMILCVCVTGFLLRSILRPDLYALVNRIPVFVMGFYFGSLGEVEVKSWKPLLVLTIGNLLAYAVNRELIPDIVPSTNALVHCLIAPPLVIFLSRLFCVCRRKGVPGVFSFFGVISLEFYALQEWVWGKVDRLGINAGRKQVLCFLVVVIGAYGLKGIREHCRGTKSRAVVE